MRILTYKRTHTGDPNTSAVFGIRDCMGSVRDLNYDAVIGVGGTGAEPRSYRIDGKITWVGVGPRKRSGRWSAPMVTFERFVLFDANGPTLASLGPNLAKRMYEGRVRYLLSSYTAEEHADAERIVNWALAATRGVSGERVKVHQGVKVRCVCIGSRSKRAVATRTAGGTGSRSAYRPRRSCRACCSASRYRA